jgi:hypothetical protein
MKCNEGQKGKGRGAMEFDKGEFLDQFVKRPALAHGEQLKENDDHGQKAGDARDCQERVTHVRLLFRQF